jgi:hypothetical protein
MNNRNGVSEAQIQSPPHGEAGSGAVPSSSIPSYRSNETRELIPGVQVTEFEATLPIEIYGELFKERS